MWACDWDGIAPDIMTLGKALGGGVMPVGAFAATEAVWQIFEENPYIHTSTFGGNPLACRAAMAAIEQIRALDVPKLAAERGAELLDGCAGVAKKHEGIIAEVRGRGLLVGVEFLDSDVAGLVIAGMSQRNVLVAYGLNNAKVLRFEPPAIITSDEIAIVVKALDEAVGQTVEMLAMM
jgi:putrescine aminotransferase